MTFRSAFLDNVPMVFSGAPTFRVDRATAVSFEDGKAETTSGETFYVPANVQPVSGRELAILPEGDRVKEQIWFYTAASIFLNDVVTAKGARFQVQVVEAWPGYVRARCARIDAGDHAAP